MSAKLHFPEQAAGLPVKPRPRGAVVDGVYGRRNCRELLEENGRGVVAGLHTITICISLYSGFWMQFLLQLLHGQPSLYALSGGTWGITPSVYYFLPMTDEIPWSMAEYFFYITLFGVIVAFIYGWHFTRGARGKWRMRGLIMVFAVLTSAWSGAALFAEGDAWRGLESRRIYYIERGYHEGEVENLFQPQIDWIDEMLLKRPK